jgi:hypothetical protein
MPYLVIKNLKHKTISVNMMGHFKIYLQKILKQDNIYFTMYMKNTSIIYSNYIHIPENLLLDHEYLLQEYDINNIQEYIFNNIISVNLKKYKDFSIELVSNLSLN